MCGFIAAFTNPLLSKVSIRRAMARMSRRGPDGEGTWHDEHAFIGHCRLAIIDLDDRASQPMTSSCGRYVIAYNGEIYNFRDLRASLESRNIGLRTQSDTEVILELFAREGAEMLSKLHGMFALVIWDKYKRKAFAARDPYGIKPLYYGVTEDGVILASQVKALLATAKVSKEPDYRGRAGFWQLGTVPEPHTLYRDIKSLPAGHYAWIENCRLQDSKCWFDIGRMWRESICSKKSLANIQDQVRESLRESVRRHLVSDVPVGIFLSGGIDSGALAGLMAEAATGQVEGLTITYDEYSGSYQDEAPDASSVAAHYGIKHHTRRVSRKEFVDDLPSILDAMDCPSIDGINTWYASKAIAEIGLKVVVSGVGGDELFYGYPSFRSLPRLVKAWHIPCRIPGMQKLGRIVGEVQARRTGNNRWAHAVDWVKTIGGAWWLRRSLFAPDDLPSLMGKQAAAEALEGFCVNTMVESMSGPLATDYTLALAQIESSTYLRNQLLRDSDWASMDHSIELRTPLVDAHLLNSLQPLLSKFYMFPNKKLLGEAPNKPLPKTIMRRKKTGFGIPINKWLLDTNFEGDWRHPSRGWGKYVFDHYEAFAGGKY